jgi:hypothetical protein
MRDRSVRRLILGLAIALSLTLVLWPGLSGGASGSTVPDNPVPTTGRLLYILKDPEGLDQAAASNLLLSSHTELGRKLTDARVRSRFHGGNVCKEDAGEKCDEVTILRKDGSNYRIVIFCSVHPDDQSFASVDLDATAMKIVRLIGKHDAYHK